MTINLESVTQWTKDTPTEPGHYLVRTDPDRWQGLHITDKCVYIDPTTGRFDAEAFGGNLDGGFEFQGPFDIPEGA